MGQPVISFASPAIAVAAILLTILAIVIARWRRVELAGTSFWAISAGLLLIALACGSPIWHRPRAGNIAIMIDLSPSTRGALFRDAAAAGRRIHELIGDAPHQLIGFASGNLPIDPTGPWLEIPADETIFAPAATDAIVLFSDARFPFPAASPPVYVVEDPGLEEPIDAAVEDLQIQEGTVSAIVRNSGSARIASLTEEQSGGASIATTQPIPEVSSIIEQALSPRATSVAVEVSPGDLWPEDDRLEAPVCPPMATERWWTGNSPAPPGWRAILPQSVPAGANAFLAPSIIVLDDVPADQLSSPSLDRLTQYVEQLGGTLLILGGPHAFAAGGYQGTPLESLSPLASSPPTPEQRWIILVDSSGSMSATAGPNASRWQVASEAAVSILKKLPPEDDVEIGQFSDEIAWWSSGKNARETAELSLPPENAAPRGPTNLEAALNAIAASPGNVPTEIIVLSDCDAPIAAPGEIASALRSGHSRLNVLAIGDGVALPAIRQIIASSDGALLSQSDPSKWIDAAKKLVQTSLPTPMGTSPIKSSFKGPAKNIAGGQISNWNHVWLKKDATPLANATSHGETVPLAASWNAGAGRVAAVAFSPSGPQLKQVADLLAQRPMDARFSVRWETQNPFRVTVDAVDRKRPMNDIAFSINFTNPSPQITLPQIGPGKYAIALKPPREPAIAILRLGSTIIDRVAVAGRYPKEFDAIGNDHQNMRNLAEQTGGAVIGPNQHEKIDFHWPGRDVELAAWLAALGSALIGAGLVRWQPGQ